MPEPFAQRFLYRGASPRHLKVAHQYQMSADRAQKGGVEQPQFGRLYSPQRRRRRERRCVRVAGEHPASQRLLGCHFGLAEGYDHLVGGPLTVGPDFGVRVGGHGQDFSEQPQERGQVFR